MTENSVVQKTIKSTMTEFDKVNEAYSRFRLNGHQKDFEYVQVWVYHWIRAFFVGLYMKKNIKCPSDVDELISKTFFIFINKHRHLKSTAIFSVWLKRICLNASIDHFRRNRVILLDDESIHDCFATMSNWLNDKADKTTIIQHVINDLKSGLSASAIKILEYKWIMKYSSEKISGIMGISVQTVKNSYSLTLKKIRQSKNLKLSY